MGSQRGCVSLLIEVGQLRWGVGRNKGKSNFVASITNIDARGVAQERVSQADGATHILKVKYTRISRETYFECPAWVVKWKWNGIESNGDAWTTHVVGVNGGWPRPIKISLLLAETCPLLRMYYLCSKTECFIWFLALLGINLLMISPIKQSE